MRWFNAARSVEQVLDGNPRLVEKTCIQIAYFRERGALLGYYNEKLDATTSGSPPAKDVFRAIEKRCDVP